MGQHCNVNSLQTICCNEKSWYHKMCLKKSAFSFASDFECPNCGDKDAFQENMLLNGVFIPANAHLPMYDSIVDEQEEDEADRAIPAAKRRRVHKNWILENTFKNKKDAEEAIQLDGQWGKYYSNKSADGLRVNYRCKAMKFRGKQCDAAKYLLFDSKSSDVHLYRSETTHSHDDEECMKNAVNRISSELETEIRKLFNLNTKPKAILYNLVLNGFKPPTKPRLITLLTKLRKEKYGAEKLNFGSLHRWLIDSSVVPSADCAPFVVNFDMLIDDNNNDNCEFRFFVSSKILLQNAAKIAVLHADATYKLIWQGFPILLLGTTDSDRRFHLIGMSVSTNEKTADFEFIFKTIKNATNDLLGYQLKPRYLVSDAAFSIKNAFANVFGHEDNKIMCWAHLRRAVVKKLPQYIRESKRQHEFVADLDKLQLSNSQEVFKRASELFIEKWEEVSNDLMEYFVQEWLNQHPNWYEGFATKIPSTNNALESFNNVIKTEQTLRERFDLSQFRVVLFKMISQWSIEYESGLNAMNRANPNIELKNWTDGYNFARSNTKITSSTRNTRADCVTYLILLGDKNFDMSPESWKTFSDFKNALNMARVTFNMPVTAENWIDGKCDCGNFFKEYICEHVIGVALRLKCVNAPVEAKTIPIGQKRKRGRPAKSRPALQRM